MSDLPPDETQRVSRHAPYPANGPVILRDGLTKVPIDITGATIVTTLALREGAAAVATFTHTVLDGTAGQFDDIGFTEAEHEAINVPAPTADSTTLQTHVRLRFDTKITGAPGLSDRIIRRGFYILQEGVTP